MVLRLFEWKALTKNPGTEGLELPDLRSVWPRLASATCKHAGL